MESSTGSRCQSNESISKDVSQLGEMLGAGRVGISLAGVEGEKQGCLYSCVGLKMGATQGKQGMKEKSRKQQGKHPQGRPWSYRSQAGTWHWSQVSLAKL